MAAGLICGGALFPVSPRRIWPWEAVDLDAGYVRIRKNRLRPKYAHGC